MEERECQQLLEVGKGKEEGSRLETPRKEHSPTHTFILALSKTIRPTDLETNIFVLF